MAGDRDVKVTRDKHHPIGRDLVGDGGEEEGEGHAPPALRGWVGWVGGLGGWVGWERGLRTSCMLRARRRSRTKSRRVKGGGGMVASVAPAPAGVVEEEEAEEKNQLVLLLPALLLRLRLGERSKAALSSTCGAGVVGVGDDHRISLCGVFT